MVCDTDDFTQRPDYWRMVERAAGLTSLDEAACVM